MKRTSALFMCVKHDRLIFFTMIQVGKDFIQHGETGVGKPAIDVDVDNHYLQFPFVCVTRLQHHSISFSETLV